MPIDQVRLPGLSPTRLVAVSLGLGGTILVLLGASIKFVTFGRGPVGGSLSVTQIDPEGKTLLTILVVAAAFVLMFAQLPYSRIWSVLSGLAFGLVIVGALGLLDRADRPDGVAEIAARALANPRPAAGFYVLVAGGALGLLGSVITLMSRRERFAIASRDVNRSRRTADTVDGTSPAPTAALTPTVQPGWYSDPTPTGEVRWWDGYAWTEHRRPGQPLPPPVPPQIEDAPTTQRPAESAPQRDGINSVVVAAAAVAAVVVVAVIVTNLIEADEGGSSAFVGVDQQATTTLDQRALRQQECIQTAFDAINAGFDSARASSAVDRQNSSLNLDGDSSWREFGEYIRVFDTTDCPSDFRTAMLEFGNAWFDYGEDYLGASKGFSLDNISNEDAAAHSRRINNTRALLEDIASEHEVRIAQMTYSIG